MNTKEKRTARIVGKIIRENRIKCGLNQMQLGKKLDCAQAALSRIENGKMLPTLVQWFEFCELTGVKPEAFLEKRV